MIPSLRQQFNSSWTAEKYAHFLGILERRFGEGPPFQHSETPCFLPDDLVNRACAAGSELVQQVLGNPAYLEAAHEAIPTKYRSPNEQSAPLFVQADFGLDAEQQLKLVEIQGFPSLYCYQPALSDAYSEAFGISDDLTKMPRGISDEQYRSLLGRAIVAGHNPENVVLLEIDPWNQKTRHDFAATGEMLGIGVIDAREVTKRGNRLFYTKGAREIPIHRIYNRVIADEVERRQITLPFDFRDELHVEWAGHPNWFFLLSKFSLPFFNHPASPRSFFLSDAGEVPDPTRYVLKPLYSFAGLGVTVGPTRDQLLAISETERGDYILQERVNFTPWIDTPAGPAKIEIRVMYLWLEELTPVNLVIRMGRGAQMGVDHNKGMRWVGASAAFIQRGQA